MSELELNNDLDATVTAQDTEKTGQSGPERTRSELPGVIDDLERPRAMAPARCSISLACLALLLACRRPAATAESERPLAQTDAANTDEEHSTPDAEPSPEPDPYTKLLDAAREAVLEGRYQDALEHFERAAAVRTHDAFARSGQAAMLMELGRLDEAQAMLEQLQVEIGRHSCPERARVAPALRANFGARQDGPRGPLRTPGVSSRRKSAVIPTPCRERPAMSPS